MEGLFLFAVESALQTPISHPLSGALLPSGLEPADCQTKLGSGGHRLQTDRYTGCSSIVGCLPSVREAPKVEPQHSTKPGILVTENGGRGQEDQNSKSSLI